MKRTMASVVLLAILVSCAPSVLEARLYDVDIGGVLRAQFEYDALGRGPAVFISDGDRLEGEYVTTTEGVSGWGGIYGLYYSVSTAQKALRGAAVVTSVQSTGWTIECEYTANGPHGQGACRDNRGARYRLLF